VSFTLLPPAVDELDEAVTYYNALVESLGEQFLEDVVRAFDLIERFPDAWHRLGQNTRRCRLLRFPYGIVYLRESSGIVVVAVAHLHRQPSYWRERIST